MIDMKEGQVSVELVMIIAIILFIFIVIVSAMGNRSDEYIYNQRLFYARVQAEQFAAKINTVAIAGHGASESIDLPQQVQDGTDYTLTIYPIHHMVEIQWMSKDNVRPYGVPIVTSNITGLTTNLNGTLTLTNNQGEISIQ